MAKTTAKSVTKARSPQKPNLVTFLERCNVLKTNRQAEHILFMAKKMPKSVTKARSRQNQIW
jgi:hypothetical protein